MISKSSFEDVPEYLIQHIQSLLPVEEATRSCILFKSWLHAWLTIPYLNFRFKSILHAKPEDSYAFLRELKTNLLDPNPILEITDILVPRMFHHSPVFTSITKPLPFQMDSLGSVTQLEIGNVLMDDGFFNTIVKIYKRYIVSWIEENLTQLVRYHFSQQVVSRAKMKAILRKDKCLATIGERQAEVTDDSKWDEMDENAITNLYLALADGVLSSIEEKKIFDDVASAILDEENRRNNKEERQTSSRQVKALVVTRERSMEPGFSESHNHATVANERRKRFAEVWMFDTCNGHELKIIRIGSIMVKIHDDNLSCKVEIQNKIMKIIKGALVLMRGEKVVANLYQLKGEIIKEEEASVALHSLSHRVAVTCVSN
nr:Gag-Pol polyprotein [Tanacetum cinerariifolium]